MPDTSARSLALEGLVIVLSILLAFGIEAAWNARLDTNALAEQVELLNDQMTANEASALQWVSYNQHSIDAQQELIRLISPTPSTITADSLASLFIRTFTNGESRVELGAMDALLSQGDLTGVGQDSLTRALMDFQAGVRGARSDGELFRSERADLINYLNDIAPGAFISARTMLHEPSDFPVPVERISSDARLEGMVGNLLVTSTRLLASSSGLQELAGAIVAMTAAPGPS